MAEVGVVLVGHGGTASALLAAARSVLGTSSLPDVVAVDAGAGETADLRTRLGAALGAADQGKGVLLLADVFGASPCACGIREAAGPLVVLSGLGLGMLLKLASVDRESQDPEAVARAVADSARRAIAVHCPPPPPPVPPAPAKEPA
jgi:PTS system mannose-specific IIA component